MSEKMKATLKEVDGLKRNLSEDEGRCAQTTEVAQVAQQQLAALEQRADANIRQTQRDLECVHETLMVLAGETPAVQMASSDSSSLAPAGASSSQPPQAPPHASSENEGGTPSLLMTPSGLPMQGVIMQGTLASSGLFASVAGAPIIAPTASTPAAGGSGGGGDVSAMPPPPARPPSIRMIAASPSSSGSNEALPPRKANLGPNVEDEAREGVSSSEEEKGTPSAEDTEAKLQPKKKMG